MLSDPVQKPWGAYVDYFRSQSCVFKVITVKPGNRLSYQKHERRNEVWYVMSGTGQVEISGRLYTASRNLSFTIYEGQPHRLTNVGEDLLIIAEMQYGDCSEDDIVRIQDDYGRK